MHITPGPGKALLQAMAELWKLPQPGPDNLLETKAFRQLWEVCRHNYPNISKRASDHALQTALRVLGLPCNLKDGIAHLASSSDDAANGLDAALRATHTKRLHLAPLDLAPEFPSLEFGPTRIDRFTPDELRSLFAATRLERMFQHTNFDFDRFSRFCWLIVEECTSHDKDAAGRGIFPLNLNDIGKIEPHKRRLPNSVEDALFFILLAPWEAWSTMIGEWRGFQVPWVHTVDSDIFVRPSAPPSPDTLCWEECTYDDGYGGIVEGERPLEFPLDDDNTTAELPKYDQHWWETVEQAKKSELFKTPIVHFFVRAFLSEGIDEFLAHLITIEAALGTQADYKRKSRHGKLSATEKMKRRVAALLGDRRHEDEYEQLFDFRSTYLHGREMSAIPADKPILARELARRVIVALIRETQAEPIASREEFLDGLLDRYMQTNCNHQPSLDRIK